MKAVIGLLTPPSPPLTATSNPSNTSIGLPAKTLICFPSHLKSQRSRNNVSRFLVFAAENNNKSNGNNGEGLLSDDEKKQRLNGNGDSINANGNVNGKGNGNGNGGEKGNGNGRPRLNLKWIDLLIDPDPENVVAVGLTGVLAWASVQVLWQLFAISIAIVLAALKYSFIAALLLFILITLL